MAIGSISNGEDGSSVRSKLNTVITEVNEITGDQQGFSYPYKKVTTVERAALTGMLDGAYVYDTDFSARFKYNGSAWIQD